RRAVNELTRGGNFVRNRTQRQQRRSPIQNMHVNFVFFLRRDSPISGRQGSAAGAIDRVAVFRQPFADSLESRDELWIDFSVRVRSDVQKQVGIISGGTDEASFNLGNAFVMAVADVESPGLVQGVGTLKRDVAGDVFCIESSSVLAG